ncbi:MAG: WYL domain-containing protein [Paludibacteraceae bacterium]|nr:WYL domain-containing protein [Paludibacteraceae bacterium]
MIDHRTLENSLKLLKMLASSIRYTPEQIGDALDVSSRTAYRYIQTLIDVGYSVQKENGMYFIPKTDKLYTDISQLVHFTEEEEGLVYDIMQSLNNDAVVQRNLKTKMAAVFNLDSLAMSVTENRAHSNLSKVLSAIKNRHQICLKDYRSSHSNTTTDRVVEPYEIIDNYSTIWAVDPTDKKNKQFKLSRASSVEDLEDKSWAFENIHQSAPVDVFRSSGQGEEYKICLELDIMAQNLMIEEYPLTKSLVKKSGDKWKISTTVYSLYAVGRFVLGLIDHITVIDSPELSKYIDDRLSKHKR